MLRHYVDPAQNDWDEHLTAAEFAINNAHQEGVQSTPFMINFGQNPLTPPSLRIPNAVQNPTALDICEGFQERLIRAKRCMEAAQQRQKAYADQGRRQDDFQVGQDVLLSTADINLKGPGTPKLMPKWIGPYKITKQVSETSYELELAPNMRIHDVFHTSQLKHYRSDGSVQPPPPQLTVDGQVEFEVQRILSHREIRRGRGALKKEYYVQWRGFDRSHDTWEPEAHLVNCPERLQEYWSRTS